MEDERTLREIVDETMKALHPLPEALGYWPAEWKHIQAKRRSAKRDER